MDIEDNIKRELERLTAQSKSVTGHKCGAVIVRGTDILCSGFAYLSSNHPVAGKDDLLQVHAEESALLNALNKGIDISGADIYVLLKKKTGEVRYTDASYSCVVCSRLLKQTNIANVIYPSPDGWAKDSVDEMFEKAEKRVEEMWRDS
ncbi:hypothetical protein ACFL26_00010 [Patescibacteria group bacterium]